MDGNLCAHKTDMLVTMHQQGKFRGVDFEPMSFELLSVTARKLLNAKGHHMPTVIARDLSKDDQREKIAKHARTKTPSWSCCSGGRSRRHSTTSRANCAGLRAATIIRTNPRSSG